MKKILMVGPANSVHFYRWAVALSRLNYNVSILTMHEPIEPYPSYIKVHLFRFSGKFGYLLNAIDKTIFGFKPKLKEFDFVHVYYASGYGILAAFTFNSPYFLSVWGSDVLIFPEQGRFKRTLLKYSLNKSLIVFCTSQMLVDKVRALGFKKRIEKIPYGVNVDQYKPVSKDNNVIRIGSNKGFSKVYGYDYLIEAFSMLMDDAEIERHLQSTGAKLELHLIGRNGSLKEAIQQRSSCFKNVTIGCEVPTSDIPAFLSSIDIFVAPSRSESFGVSVLEASLSSLPVIVSDIDGLLEVVNENESGLVFQTGNSYSLYKALKVLVLSSSMREKLGNYGRQFVLENFSFEGNVKKKVEVYSTFFEQSRSSN